ncbi:unnamed protein product [Paramecium octaurelia]|uniref:Uncharacterized protein n=1 Tax=Paramecium octaurelia TaxID=43137 RepID=A0A8S1SL93_PAROT|nr:unnamed protein product [Paramecium octaurelia]
MIVLKKLDNTQNPRFTQPNKLNTSGYWKIIKHCWQNQSKLNQAITVTQIYVYITGFSVFLIFILMSFYWMKRKTSRLQLMRLSLTLIPYDILLEPKTLSSLKQL